MVQHALAWQGAIIGAASLLRPNRNGLGSARCTQAGMLRGSFRLQQDLGQTQPHMPR